MEKRKITEEIDFKELLKSPQRLFGWVFVYFFLLIVILGIFFGHRLIPISFNEQNVGVVDITNLKLELDEIKGGVVPAVNLTTIKNPTQEMIANGKGLYDSNCKSCHGENGKGDGPSGTVLNPKPRNFHEVDGWTNGRTMHSMYKTLHEGIVSRGMAAYEYISPSNRIDIIHYIRTFADFPIVTDDEVKQMDLTFNLSLGTLQPNQIPVDKAISKIIFEQDNIINKMLAAKTKITQHVSDDSGAKLFEIYSLNHDRILQLFISQPNITELVFNQFLIVNPINYGFKPSILSASKEELKVLFIFLKSITS